MAKGVYARGGLLWIRWTDAKGERQWRPTGLRVGDEAKAAAALVVIKRQAMAERELLQQESEGGPGLPAVSGGVTVAMYWNHRLKARQRNPETASAAKANVWHGRDHILPSVGHIALADFKPAHAEAFVNELKAKRLPDGTPQLAPRTIHTIWHALRGMFRTAVVGSYVPSNPCVLERGVLPKKKDKDPHWRRTAVFSREEVETLISDERIPLQRRVLYAILFLAGVRPGEASALRWSYYDTSWQPLGLLDIQRAYDTDGRAEGETKTDKQRLVPVHPTLARMLAQWKLSGWAAHLGRAPKPDDLIVPNQQNTYQSGNGMRNRALDDLATLGWRKRRFYDTRRTFISRCQADLIPKDIYRWWTHGPPSGADAVDLYASVDWPAHCREILKLKVDLKEGLLLKLAAVGADNRDSEWDSLRLVPGMTSESDVGARGFEPPPSVSLSSTSPRRLAEPLREAGRPEPTADPGFGGTVSLSLSDAAGLVVELRDATNAFAASHDADGLRQRLEAVLGVLRGGR